jgi:uncharacterized protein
VIAIAAAVVFGAMAQRVSGMGFALTAAPVLVLLIGPFDGVLLVNLAGAASASIVISRVWRDIDWRMFALITIPAVAAIIPGALVSVLIGGPALQIVIGGILVVALTISLLIRKSKLRVAVGPAAVFSGAASGFMSATAGVGGPGVAVFAVLTQWEHRTFAATIQPFFVTIGVTSFVVKVVLADQGLPDYDWWVWPLIIVSTLIGLALGEYVIRIVSTRVAKLAVIVIAYAGGFAAIIDGVLEIMLF